jgi:CDP-diacylglycerol--serine O-phosphatidyltransferase
MRERRWKMQSVLKLESQAESEIRRRLRLAAPNLLTLCTSLCALAAMYVAYEWRVRTFALLLFFSGIFDALDGPVARRLNAKSRFGNVYDSMSDLLAFGVAPAVCLVLLDLCHPIVAGVYLLAIQFRLTRFSAMPDDGPPQRFFQGVCAPDASYLGLLLGMLPYSNFDIGFAAVSVLAVYPGKLWPKGYRAARALLALAVVILFAYFEP